jgi:hypothetical protein
MSQGRRPGEEIVSLVRELSVGLLWLLHPLRAVQDARPTARIVSDHETPLVLSSVVGYSRSSDSPRYNRFPARC